MLARLAKGVGANALGQLVLVIVQLVQVPILASHWGLERYGLWIMLSTVPIYLAFSDLGFGKAAANDMIMRTAVDDRAGALCTYQSATLLVYALTLAMLAVFQAIVWLLPAGVFGAAAPPAESRLTLSLLVGYGMISLAGGVSSSGPLQSSGHFAVEATGMALTWAVQGAAVCLIAVAGGSMTRVALALLLTQLCAVLGLTLAARKCAPWLTLGWAHARMVEIRRLTGPATAMMTLPLANALILQGTAAAVGLAASPAAVPAFTASRTLSRVPMQLAGILVRAAMPEFGAATARGDQAGQRRLLALAIVSSLVLLTPAALVLAVAGPRIILLWTHGVVHASHLLLIAMSLVLLANGLWVPLSNFVISANRPSLFTFHFVVTSAAAVPVAYLLARWVGSLGGALAMMLVDGVMLLLLVQITDRLFGPLRLVLASVPEALNDGLALLRRGRGAA